ncbi:MAG TPA: c-type cytochrome [Planctomycetes bacterium]|nr:c-type cytochrome [Planctomycetota bacterium]
MDTIHNKRLYVISVLILVLALTVNARASDYYSPAAVALDNAGQYLYIAEHTANQIEEFNTSTKTVTRTLSLDKAPTGVVCSSSGKLYITAGDYNGKVYVIDTTETEWAVNDTIDVGHTPMSPGLSSDGLHLYICNRFDGTVMDIGTASGTVLSTIDVVREPVAAAITPTSDKLVVVNQLPDGAANTGTTGCDVSVMNTSGYAVTNIELYNGSTGAKGVCISPDGNYAYITHIIGRYQVPTSQLERGWIMTNAMSIINLNTSQIVNTVLLDDVEMGAANPWGIACTSDGSKLVVAHSGSHELSIIDRNGVHNRLSNLPYTGGFSQTSTDVRNDLGFLSGLRNRIQLPGKGPRAVAVYGNKAYVAEYFSDSISIINIDTKAVEQALLGSQNPMDQVRLGEFYFYDAQQGTFQKWLSCNSCHPDVRADALNWDLANDGYGSPRNAKSLLKSHYTPPAMITGIRPDAETAVRAGFKFIQFAIRTEDDAGAVDAFLGSVEPVESPYLVNGELSEAAERGKDLFDSAYCSVCHYGRYYTDQSSHDVGTGRGGGESFDTPTLTEVWRTGPYLQDGRAATMLEVLTTYNPGDRHGVTSDLTEQQRNDLAEYVLSLGVSQETCIGDFDGNGGVGPEDLEILAAAWLSFSGGSNWNHVCDISDPNDLVINGKDFAVFSGNWLCP